MKKLTTYSTLLLLFISSCTEKEPDSVIDNTLKYSIIDFEDIGFEDDGYGYGTLVGDDPIALGYKIHKYTNSDINFTSYVKAENESFSWMGVAYSNRNEMTAADISNQYSVYYNDKETNKGGAEGSINFAIIQQDFLKSDDYVPTIKLKSFESKVIDHIYITNSTYTALSILNGNGITDKFEDGDWFKIIIKGFDASGNKIGEPIEFYLADYRDGKAYIVKEWRKISLLELGKVNKLTITFDGSDKGFFGINTPAYACIDNITIQNNIK